MSTVSPTMTPFTIADATRYNQLDASGSAEFDPYRQLYGDPGNDSSWWLDPSAGARSDPTTGFSAEAGLSQNAFDWFSKARSGGNAEASRQAALDKDGFLGGWGLPLLAIAALATGGMALGGLGAMGGAMGAEAGLGAMGAIDAGIGFGGAGLTAADMAAGMLPEFGSSVMGAGAGALEGMGGMASGFGFGSPESLMGTMTGDISTFGGSALDAGTGIPMGTEATTGMTGGSGNGFFSDMFRTPPGASNFMKSVSGDGRDITFTEGGSGGGGSWWDKLFGGGGAGGSGMWGLGSSAGSLLSGLGAFGQGRDLEKTATGLRNNVDAMGSVRGPAALALLQLMNDPSSITSRPGFGAGQLAIDRSLSKQGYNPANVRGVSGNYLDAQSNYAGNFYDKEMQRLMKMAGADFNPVGAAQLQLQGLQGQAGLTGAGTQSTIAGLTGLLRNIPNIFSLFGP